MKRFFSKGLAQKIHSEGFTLIELLVVISIIGILAGFIMANYLGVQQRARDAQRKSDLLNLRAALEIYRADKGTYPDGSINGIAELTNAPCQSLQFCDTDNIGVVYMKKVPKDPTNSGSYVYTYTTPSGGASYTLHTCLENPNDAQKSTTLCAGSTTNYLYIVDNP